MPCIRLTKWSRKKSGVENFYSTISTSHCTRSDVDRVINCYSTSLFNRGISVVVYDCATVHLISSDACGHLAVNRCAGMNIHE
jgi:hypothetical protein